MRNISHIIMIFVIATTMIETTSTTFDSNYLQHQRSQNNYKTAIFTTILYLKLFDLLKKHEIGLEYFFVPTWFCPSQNQRQLFVRHIGYQKYQNTVFIFQHKIYSLYRSVLSSTSLHGTYCFANQTHPLHSTHINITLNKIWESLIN